MDIPAVTVATLFWNRCWLVSVIGYWKGLSASASFSQRTMKTCLQVLHMDIIGVWNINDKHGVLDQGLLIQHPLTLLIHISYLRARSSRQWWQTLSANKRKVYPIQAPDCEFNIFPRGEVVLNRILSALLDCQSWQPWQAFLQLWLDLRLPSCYL